MFEILSLCVCNIEFGCLRVEFVFAKLSLCVCEIEFACFARLSFCVFAKLS